jgi:hypothetical protein
MSTDKSRKIPLDQLQQIAQEANRTVLKDYDIPDTIRKNLALGILIEGDNRVFQLYVPAERPEDGQVISRVTVNSHTGKVSAVEVFAERKTE